MKMNRDLDLNFDGEIGPGSNLYNAGVFGGVFSLRETPLSIVIRQPF